MLLSVLILLKMVKPRRKILQQPSQNRSNSSIVRSRPSIVFYISFLSFSYVKNQRSLFLQVIVKSSISSTSQFRTQIGINLSLEISVMRSRKETSGELLNQLLKSLMINLLILWLEVMSTNFMEIWIIVRERRITSGSIRLSTPS